MWNTYIIKQLLNRNRLTEVFYGVYLCDVLSLYMYYKLVKKVPRHL